MDIFELYDELYSVCASLVQISVRVLKAFDPPIKVLYVELHSAKIKHLQRIDNIMMKYGFKLEKIMPRYEGAGIALMYTKR